MSFIGLIHSVLRTGSAYLPWTTGSAIPVVGRLLDFCDASPRDLAIGVAQRSQLVAAAATDNK